MLTVINKMFFFSFHICAEILQGTTSVGIFHIPFPPWFLSIICELAVLNLKNLTLCNSVTRLDFSDIFLKFMALGMLVITRYPSQSETFLLILVALQPCKIPYFGTSLSKYSASLMP